MLRNFSDIHRKSSSQQKKRIAVAAAQDAGVLQAVYRAYQQGIADAVLVGVAGKIRDILRELAIPGDLFEIFPVDGDLAEQSRDAVHLVTEGQADLIMKGQVDTVILLKAILSEPALRTGRIMSHVAVMQVAAYDKLLLPTDCGMNISPGLAQKQDILANALEVARALEINQPKVGIICAKEKVSPKMQDTLDAQALVELNQAGKLGDCIVGGPFALDNAISPAAAKQKGIVHPVAGDADILLMPNLVAGNIFYKTLVFLAEAENAGVIVGAKVPIVLTSRADDEAAKLNSISVAALMA
ncbi:MAG: bifunctional enoyl-CoA hydratase/phosphate acetyltransferase [Deltaproteobacteria bacterium]|jgi:phosphate butyryltransferase|nr:bifunctional enoyl-CoA hydratase/phosphate acetyltransferase [Deltaproteobacteria bacterium]